MPESTPAYFSGQGRVLVADRDDSGNPLAFRKVGNIPSCNLGMTTDTIEHQESQSGQRLVDKRLIKGKKANCTFSLEEWTKDNLALAFYGASSAITAGTVSGETFPDALAVGDFVRLQLPNATSIVITDSAGTPATLVEGTDYAIESGPHGTIEILDLGAYTQPLVAAYSNGAATNVNLFTQPAPERWIRIEGLNTADDDQPVLIEFYRVALDPGKEMDFISDDIAKFDLAGSILYDSTKESDDVLGQFGRVVLLDG